MFFYRIFQFNKAILASIKGITEEDIKFVKTYLNPDEVMIFNMMSSFDKLHCIRVARELEVYNYNEDIQLKNKLIKIALIHDVGKSILKYSIFDRILLVLIRNVYQNSTFKFCWKKAEIYYNHARIGYDILKKYGFDEEILFVVRNHHNKVENNKMVKILMRCDEKN